MSETKDEAVACTSEIPLQTANRTLDEWAACIRGHIERGLSHILQAGRELNHAKEEVAHGDWLPLLAKIGIENRYAQKLMAIARNPVLADARHVAQLPPAVDHLSALAALPAEQIEVAIKSGDIHPQMTVREARAMRDKEGAASRSQSKRRRSNGSSPVEARTKSDEETEFQADVIAENYSIPVIRRALTLALERAGAVRSA